MIRTKTWLQAGSAPLSMVLLIACVLLVSATRSHAVTFQIEYVDNVEGDFAARGWLSAQSLFQRNVAAAAAGWGASLASDEVLLLRVEASRFVARAGGTFSNGYTIAVVEGRDLVEPGPLSRIRTGTNPGEPFFGFDILVSINGQFVDDFYWLDTNPEQRIDPVPFDRGDFISVIQHEVGHGLGMAGARSFANDASYGTLPPDFFVLFDYYSSFGGNGLVEDEFGSPNPMQFNGPVSSALYGAPVPLANVGRFDFLFSQNFYHLGTCGDPIEVTGSLMNGCAVPPGARLPITALDLAVYDDLGYETVPEPDARVALAASLVCLLSLGRRRTSRVDRRAVSG